MHTVPAMHLITLPCRVHDFRHFWPSWTTIMRTGREVPSRTRSSSTFFWQRVGPCPGPVCNFDMKFFIFLFSCFSNFFFEPAPSFPAYSKRCAPYGCVLEIQMYTCTYNIDVLPLLSLGHFLRLKSLHMQFSTDTRTGTNFRRHTPPAPLTTPLSTNSQHNSMYPVFTCTRVCTDMYDVVGNIGIRQKWFPGAQEIFAQRPTRWLPKASCHFPWLHSSLPAPHIPIPMPIPIRHAWWQSCLWNYAH